MSTDNTLEQHLSQEDIDSYLDGIGLYFKDAVRDDMVAAIGSLIPKFLSLGTICGTVPLRYTNTHDSVSMLVNYYDRYLVLTRIYHNVIEISYHNTASYVEGIRVHPKHLDAVLCHMLIGPDGNAGLYKHAMEQLGTSCPPLIVDVVVPLIPKFIEAGGTYEQVVDTTDGINGIKESWGGGTITGVRGTYKDRSLLIANPILGTLGIALIIPNHTDAGVVWETIVVHPQDLDAALCYWLKVPEGEL